MTLSAVKQLLLGSVGNRKEPQTIARWLTISLWFVIAGMSVTCISFLFSPEINVTLLVIDAVALLAAIIALLVAYTGYTRLAGYIVVSVVFFLNSYGYIVLGPNISLPNAIGYVAIITVAGLFFGSQGVLALLCLSLVVVGGTFSYGQLFLSDSAGVDLLKNMGDVTSVVTVLCLTSVVLYLLFRKNLDVVHEIEQVAAALDLSNHELLQHQKQLEEAQNQLEKLVERRTAQLSEANKQLQMEVDKRQSILDALHQSEAKWRSLVNSAPDHVLTFTPEGTTTFVNRTTVGNFTLPVQEGEKIDSLYEDEDNREALTKAIEHARSTRQAVSLETLLNTADGPLYLMHRLAAIESNEELTGLILTTTDISENKRTELAMRQTQKLESLGLFAGGVAHDFNNLLTAILAQNSLMLTRVSPNDTLASHIHKAIMATEQAMHLTRQMLDYTGRTPTQNVPIDLSQLIRNNTALFSAALPKNVDISLDVEHNLPCIQGDIAQMQQLLMNLLLNGADAIGKGHGLVKIVAQAAKICSESAEYSHWVGAELKPGEYVKLQVTDNGCGMNAETLSKIFDPFFTTKFTGRGLGLASVLGIVRNHKGGLAVESSLGVGTTFTLIFPALSVKQMPSKYEQVVPTREFDGERVLVVDDEDAVREAAVDILTSVGLEVIPMADGQSAVAYYQNGLEKIDIVILDLSMPGMSGEEVLHILRQMDQQVPIILTSGYDERDVMRRFQKAEHTSFIQKPYDLDRLLESVARYL